MDIRVLTDAAAVAEAAASFVARSIRGVVARRGEFRLAVSGGSTPAAMLDVLARTDLPWDKVQIHQVDERVAPDGSSDRNATQLEEHLLRPLRRRAGRVPDVVLLPVTAADTERSARDAARRLERTGPFDLVHLGVGDDGHTASWPPGVEVPANRAVAVVGPFNGTMRMTITPPVVDTARRRLVVVSGAAKAAAVQRWLLDDPEVPISRVARRGTVVLLDAAAAASVAPWTRST